MVQKIIIRFRRLICRCNLWMIPFLNELISAKKRKIVFDGIDQAELDNIINFLHDDPVIV